MTKVVSGLFGGVGAAVATPSPSSPAPEPAAAAPAAAASPTNPTADITTRDQNSNVRAAAGVSSLDDSRVGLLGATTRKTRGAARSVLG